MDNVTKNDRLDNPPVVPRIKSHAPNIVRQKGQIKRTLAYHLAGIGPRSGLLFKALEKLGVMLDSTNPEEVMQAVDKVIKLLPYAIEREGSAQLIPGANGASTVNIQINNFDSFIKNKLSQTNLGRLLAQNIQQADTQEAQVIETLTPPPTPGAG